MQRIFFLAILITTLIFPSILQAETGKRIALVIGNSRYASSPLKNPVNDAIDMADVLKKWGFHVILKTNGSKKEMGKAVDDFGNQLKKYDVGLFFYAGHAVQLSGVNYLIPIGANIIDETDVEYEAIDVGRILAKMHNVKGKINIIILDACRDNPYFQGFRSSSRGLAMIAKAPMGTIISYSTSPGGVALDGKGRNSPYTSSLIKYMNEPGLAIEHVFKKTREKLAKETSGRQIPWELSSLQGDFYFVPSLKKSDVPKGEDTYKIMKAERQVDTKTKQAFELMGTETGRDGRFVAYNNGTVLDTKTNLMWADKDNYGGITWHDSKLYCENYRGGGYTDWRMPTLNELESLFDIHINGMNGYNLTRFIELTSCCPWASNKEGVYFRFDGGGRDITVRPFIARSYRALPVRSAK